MTDDKKERYRPGLIGSLIAEFTRHISMECRFCFKEESESLEDTNESGFAYSLIDKGWAYRIYKSKKDWEGWGCPKCIKKLDEEEAKNK